MVTHLQLPVQVLLGLSTVGSTIKIECMPAIVSMFTVVVIVMPVGTADEIAGVEVLETKTPKIRKQPGTALLKRSEYYTCFILLLHVYVLFCYFRIVLNFARVLHSLKVLS